MDQNGNETNDYVTSVRSGSNALSDELRVDEVVALNQDLRSRFFQEQWRSSPMAGGPRENSSKRAPF